MFILLTEMEGMRLQYVSLTKSNPKGWVVGIRSYRPLLEFIKKDLPLPVHTKIEGKELIVAHLPVYATRGMAVELLMDPVIAEGLDAMKLDLAKLDS